MRRRAFISLRGGAAAWPLAARVQQRERMRRVALLMSVDADDAEGQSRVTAFAQGLQELGWSEGRNLRVEYRWAAGNADNIRKHAAELVAIKPDVIVGTGTPTVTSLAQATHTVPVVFVQITDPVGAGLVENLARPSGNMTGFTNFEYSLSGKWSPPHSRKKEHELSDHRSTQFHPSHRRGNPWRRPVQSAREPAIPGNT